MSEQTLEKYYMIELSNFEDTWKRPRQMLTLRPTLIYQNVETVRDARCLHLTWYSNPDKSHYNDWTFIQLVIAKTNMEIIQEQDLMAEIVHISKMQPHEFEARLQILGYRKNSARGQ